ncbi:hypothetical protein FB451DRAFT_1561979 [Mycena latifolia]|nr:hypothetical protein FB451DRAFT_1561979 [Mycena latifolia]
MAFNSNEPAIGRIPKSHIAPPRDVLAARRCIAAPEKKPVYRLADVYQNISSRNPIAPLYSLHALSEDDSLVATAEKSLVLVQAPSHRRLYHRPLKILSAHEASPQKSVPEGSTTIQVEHEKWLSVPSGEIVHTNGILMKQTHRLQSM